MSDNFFKKYGVNLSARLAKLPGDWNEKVRIAKRVIAENYAERRDEMLTKNKFCGVLVAFNDHPGTVLSEMEEVVAFVDREIG